jgi:hypothetical protein
MQVFVQRPQRVPGLTARGVIAEVDADELDRLLALVRSDPLKRSIARDIAFLVACLGLCRNRVGALGAPGNPSHERNRVPSPKRPPARAFPDESTNPITRASWMSQCVPLRVLTGGCTLPN